MPRFIDLTGKIFSKLTVCSKADTKNGQARWFCKCSCGNTHTVYSAALRNKSTKSCGCYNRKIARRTDNKGTKTHGMSKTSEYSIYCHMKSRCYKKDDPAYYNYGERGIKMSKSWYNSFEQFFKDMGLRPKGLTLERKDNNKGYSKSNCKWATRTEQANNKRNNRILEYENKRMTIAQWARKTGISAYRISSRINNEGWSIEKALTTPVH